MEIRKVSSKSQLTLPKEFAGKLVSIETLSKGTLQIKTGEFIPHSEKIFHTEEYQKRLRKFDEWMDKHDPEESNVAEFQGKFQGD
jgi:bifunctional DNA-binding transcriptional regulator/antitoxin component of YhaV-PrlF toxin-antitoxin module